MMLLLSPSLLALGLCLSSTAFAVVPLSSIDKSSESRYVPNRYIVELADVQALPTKRDVSPHGEFYEAMRKRAIDFELNTEYNEPELLVGASVTLKSSEDVAELLAIEGVQSVRPVTRIPAPNPVNEFAVSDPSDSRLPQQPFSTHLMTGVDKVHASGNKGQGIKIGIIDSGLDYKHPALGAGIGKGYKVIGGHDFVGDDYTGTNTPVPDEDPMDCGGHGTHVAGIIGANPDNAFDIIGVAPKASLASYRVFGCSGSTTDEIIVQALLRANKDGMDIITLSLGGPDGWTSGIGSVVASRLAARGKVVTIAAGNDGALGSWYTSGPGNGIDVISVGSVDNTVIPVQRVTVNGVAHEPIVYLQGLPLPVTDEFPIYAISNNTAVVDDACSPLPASTPDLSGFVTVVRRGGCNFTVKLENIAAKGGKVVLIYNNGGSFSPISTGNFTLVALISEADGAFLVEQFVAKSALTLHFPQEGGSFGLENTLTGGLISSFSTYGPTNDMFFKPALAAPGGNILSTIPLAQGGFGIKSGTSMATPFTAGAAALILKAKGTSRTVSRGVRDLLQTTAAHVPSSKTDGTLPQTASVQGAGLIQVFNAITTKTIISPGQLTLNDTANFGGSHTITIKNTNSKRLVYTLSHQAAGTAASVTNGESTLGPVTLSNSTPTKVTFSTSKITVDPGRSVQIQVKFTRPSEDNIKYPVYSGFISIISSTGEVQKVTYLGLAASLKTRSILDNTDAFFGVQLPILLDAAGEVQTEEKAYTLTGTDFPTIITRLLFGSPTVQIDLVSKNTTFTPTLESRAPGWLGKSVHLTGSFDKVPTIGNLALFKYVPRNALTQTAEANGFSIFNFDGTFANQTRIPAGEYRALIRALKVTGNPRDSQDYESWLSPGITVVTPA